MQDTEPSPILVTNPYNNTVVDVLPIFAMLDGLDGPVGRMKDVTARIDDAIRHFNLLINAEPVPTWEQIRAQVNYDLYTLRDTFAKMNEYSKGK